MVSTREHEEQQFEEELRKATDNCKELDNSSDIFCSHSNSSKSPRTPRKSPYKSTSSCNTSPYKSPRLSPRKSIKITTGAGSENEEDFITNRSKDGSIKDFGGFENNSDMESNQDENDEFNDEEEEDDEEEEEEEEFCWNCQRLMSQMRKSAIRWLYMEWYKKAVLGQHLPTVSVIDSSIY